MYGQTFTVPMDEDFVIPIGRAKIEREGKDVTIVAYSIMVGKALAAAEKLAEQGIDAEVINLRTIQPARPLHHSGEREENQPHRFMRGKLALRRHRRGDRRSVHGARIRLPRCPGETRVSGGCADAVCRQSGGAGLAAGG